MVIQERKTAGFTSIKVSNAIHVYLKQDSVSSVKVETDENLQDYIRVTEDNGMLYIEQRNNTRLNPTGKVAVFVNAPLFKQLHASGASEFHGQNILSSNESISIIASGASEAELQVKAPSVSGELSGASKLRLTGQTRDLRIKASGASHAYCYDLLSENTAVDVSGASNAQVFASIKLDAESSGASGVRYKGKPEVTQRVSGAGSVKDSN